MWPHSIHSGSHFLRAHRALGTAPSAGQPGDRIHSLLSPSLGLQLPQQGGAQMAGHQGGANLADFQGLSVPGSRCLGTPVPGEALPHLESLKRLLSSPKAVALEISFLVLQCCVS